MAVPNACTACRLPGRGQSTATASAPPREGKGVELSAHEEREGVGVAAVECRRRVGCATRNAVSKKWVICCLSSRYYTLVRSGRPRHRLSSGPAVMSGLEVSCSAAVSIRPSPSSQPAHHRRRRLRPLRRRPSPSSQPPSFCPPPSFLPRGARRYPSGASA